MGRKPLGKQPMTAAQKQRRYRQKHDVELARARMVSITAAEHNAYAEGWNDRTSDAKNRPPTDANLRYWYDRGYNHADEVEQ